MIVDTKEVVITITYMINVRMSTLTASYGKCAVFILIFISESQPVKPVTDRLLCIGAERLCCLSLYCHTASDIVAGLAACTGDLLIGKPFLFIIALRQSSVTLIFS